MITCESDVPNLLQGGRQLAFPEARLSGAGRQRLQAGDAFRLHLALPPHLQCRAMS